MEYSDKKNLPKDSSFYKIILYELGPMLWTRTRGLYEKIRKQVFVLACNLIKDYKISCDLNFQEKYFEKVFLKKDYTLWKLVSLYVMLGVKIEND